MFYPPESYSASFIHGNIGLKVKIWVSREKFVLQKGEMHQTTQIFWANNVAC